MTPTRQPSPCRRYGPAAGFARAPNDTEKWAYERELWAKQKGLKKGRVEMKFEPKTETTRALAESLEVNKFLPDTAREAATSINWTLARRAHKKLDEHSAAVVGESVEELMREMEVQARLLEEKEIRIRQAERLDGIGHVAICDMSDTSSPTNAPTCGL
jgi:hypothetical protein